MALDTVLTHFFIYRFCSLNRASNGKGPYVKSVSNNISVPCNATGGCIRACVGYWFLWFQNS